MDNNRDKLSSHVIVNSSSIQSNNVINNEDTITAPSSISNVTDKEEPFLSNALQASTTVISPDTEHQFLGNISIINRLEIEQEVMCIRYTETYDFLAAGLSNGNVKLYEINSGENTLTLCDVETMQNPAPVTAIKHRPVHQSHPITRTVLATYASGCVKCWHYPTAQCLYTIREGRQTFGVTYHPYLPKFVTFGDDATLCLYDEETKTRERIFRGSDMPYTMDGHKSRIFSASFNPKSSHELISGGWDDSVQFWDIRQAHSFRHISGVHMCGDGLDISKNGKEILTCAWQKNDPLQLWDYGSGRLIVSMEPDNYPSLLYAGNYITNVFIACGGCDTNLFRIVDLRSYSTIAMIRNLKGGVYSIDIGSLKSKYLKENEVSETAYLPKIAFCAGTTIFEIDAQPG